METCEGHDELWLKLIQSLVTITAGVVIAVYLINQLKKYSGNLLPCLKGESK